jgi:hypothetical protein
VVPRLTATLGDGPPIGAAFWRAARITLPPALRQSRWHRSIGQGTLEERDGAILLSDALSTSPVELLIGGEGSG